VTAPLTDSQNSGIIDVVHRYLYDELKHYFMPKVKIHNHLIKRQKIRPYIIKGIGNQIERKGTQQLNKNYNDTIIYESNRYFVVYAFQEEQDDIITFIREMKKAVKK